MRITKLDIKGFGKLENRVFLPNSGLNIFYGSNEAGKSTIQAFVKAMLFGLKGGRRTREGEVSQNKRFKPWFGKSFAGLLEYKLDNGCFFSVGRNFENNTLTVYDEYSNNITAEFPADKDAVASFAEQHLGLSKSVFERTAFIGQLQSVVNQAGRKILAEHLVNLKESGDEKVSFQTAVNALKQAQLTYVGSDRSTTRPINLLNTQLQNSMQKEKTARDLHTSSIETFIELGKTQKELEARKEQLNELNKTHERLYQNAKVKKLNDKHIKLCEYSKQIEEVEKNRRRAEEQKENLLKESEVLKGFSEFTRNDADRMVEDSTRYQLLLDELEEISQQSSIIEDKIDETEKDLAQYGIFKREGHRMQEVLDSFLKLENTQLHEKQNDMAKNLTKQKKMSFVGICLSIALLAALYFFRTDIPLTLFRVLAILGASFFLITVQMLVRILLKQKSGKDTVRESKDIERGTVKESVDREKGTAKESVDRENSTAKESMDRENSTAKESMDREKSTINENKEKEKGIGKENEKKGKGINDEIRKRQKDSDKENGDAAQKMKELRQLLNDWMIEADVAYIHDFMRLKSMYDDKQNSLKVLYEKRNAYIDEKMYAEDRSEAVRTNILGRLQKGGICEDCNTFIIDDIANWKKGLEAYISFSPALEVVEKEILSLAQRGEGIYSQAGLVYGEDIKNQTQLEKAINELKGILDGEKPVFDEEEQSLFQIEEQIKSLQEEINHGILQVNTLTTRLENIPDSEMLQKAFENTQDLKDEKEKIVLLGKSIETAISVLTEASVAIQRDYVPHLSRELSRYLTTITGGVYDNAAADDNLVLNILTDEHMERVMPEQLSSGTIDQVYLALRIASVKMIEKESETIPLFFDEPFSQYDEERTKNALRLLIDESSHRQIFLYTCKKREVELAGELERNGAINIINL